ncbi:MAG: chromosomal replication initiator protein DnaA [Fidelibacterota bacterium]
MENLKTSYIDLWNEVKINLKAQFPNHAYSTWFEPIQPIGLNDSEFVLEVPNQFFFEWIKSHYNQTVERIVRNKLGRSITVKYTVSPETEKFKSKNEYTQKKEFIQRRAKKNIQLNEKYTFSNFIEGNNNQFAKAAALTVAEEPGKHNFNPLVIYAGVGMGKTHILHAIGNKILKEKASLKIVCASSEKFTMDFISSIQKNRTVEFSRHYRDADLLLIDDIQFFQGKEQTQEQFFHTFNELFQAGKQIVLTADRYPGEMAGLQSRLLSRFKSGLAVDIQPPDFETRVAILMEKAEQNGLRLEYEIIELIATHIKNNVRELESTIIRILAHSSLSNREINYSLAKSVIKERIGKRALTEITAEDIIRRVSESTNVAEKDIVSSSRKMEISEARQISIYLIREILGTPLVSIGMHFGGRDHSTIIHACRQIEMKSKNDIRVRALVSDLKNELSFAMN